MQRSEYPMFIFSSGKKPTNSFDLPDGKSPRISWVLDSPSTSSEKYEIRPETLEHRKHKRKGTTDEYVFVDHS